MSEEDSEAAFERYAVPGPGRVLFQGAFANFNPRAATRVDFHNEDRAPLLLIAGEDDHTVPAAVDRSAAKHYRKSSAITEYKEFVGGAFVLAQGTFSLASSCWRLRSSEIRGPPGWPKRNAGSGA